MDERWAEPELLIWNESLGQKYYSVHNRAMGCTFCMTDMQLLTTMVSVSVASIWRTVSNMPAQT